MKILLISNAFPNSTETVRGIFTYQIVKALQKKCEIEVVAPLPWVPPFLKNMSAPKYPHAAVPKKENIDSITVYHPRYLVIPKILGFMHAIFMYFPMFKVVRELTLRDKVDLINAHWVFPDGVAAAWVGKRLRKPVVLTALGCDINLYSRMLLRRIQISKALRNTNFITAVSNDLKDKIISLNILPHRVDAIPNGVDHSLFTIIDKLEARKKLGISPDKSFILTVGSLDEVKGTQYLIEAIATLKKKNNSLTILISIGDGPLEFSLRSLAEKLGIAEDVRFLGNRPHKEIPLWMNAANLFCLPSIREGHPNVVIESLACGLPVVASNVGAISEIINETNGYIWKNRNVEDLAWHLKSGLSRNWDRDAIRRSVVSSSWENCAKRYHSIYSAVLSG